MASSSEQIRDFWEWFEVNFGVLSGDIDAATIGALEQRLFAIARLDWEIGPGLEQPHMFALSPAGRLDELALTRQIVAMAPTLSDWEFHPAKPRKQWELFFEVAHGDRLVPVDGRAWEYVIYRFKDGAVDIVLRPPDDLDLPRDMLETVAAIIVDGELGEEVRTTRVNQIDVVSRWEPRAARSARKLEVGMLHRFVAGQA